MARSVVLPALFLGVASWSSSVVSASKEDSIPVYRAYDGPSRPAESIALLHAGADTWIRAIDGRALADIRVGVFFEVPAARHSLRMLYEPKSSAARGFQSAEPAEFTFEPGRVYRVRWERREKIWWPVIEPHPEPLPELAKKGDEPCWYDEIRGQIESFVWGKTMRERLKNKPLLTLRVDGAAEPQPWTFSSLGVLARPEGKMQELAGNWSVDGTFFGYMLGTKPLVPGRRVRALVSTCRPNEVREVILE